MVTNRISATLTPEASAAAMKAIADLREDLPFLLDLSVEERKALPKMGDRSRAFAVRAYNLAVQNPDFLPRNFKTDEMKLDIELFESMHPLIMAITQLWELMDDTYKAVEAEAFSAALAVYNYAKASELGLGLDEAVKDLAKRFERGQKSEEGGEEELMAELAQETPV